MTQSRTFILRDDAIRQRAADAVLSCPVSAEQPLQVVIGQYKRKRSLAQNALMWMWIDAIRLHILDSTGQRFSKEDVHKWLADEFLPSSVVEINGRAKRVRAHTSELSVGEMRDYLDRLDYWASAELHCDLPRPVGLWAEAMGRAA